MDAHGFCLVFEVGDGHLLSVSGGEDEGFVRDAENVFRVQLGIMVEYPKSIRATKGKLSGK
jgi:hypothetical protein